MTGKTLLRNELLAKVLEEFEVLYEFLEKLPHVLAKGGRVAILSFHSGEDRLVKKSFKSLLREGVYNFGRNMGINEPNLWGDYFYFEALVRLSRVWTPYFC